VGGISITVGSSASSRAAPFITFPAKLTCSAAPSRAHSTRIASCWKEFSCDVGYGSLTARLSSCARKSNSYPASLACHPEGVCLAMEPFVTRSTSVQCRHCSRGVGLRCSRGEPSVSGAPLLGVLVGADIQDRNPCSTSTSSTGLSKNSIVPPSTAGSALQQHPNSANSSAAADSSSLRSPDR